MSGIVKQFVDFATGNDSGANNASSIQPVVNGEAVNQTVLQRPSENLRERTEALRNAQGDSLYLRDADRNLIVAGPGKVKWKGTVAAGQDGVVYTDDVLYVLPMLTPGYAQVSPTPPVASAYGVLHLKRNDSVDCISVTSMRRSYAGGDRINITVSSGAAFSCALNTEDGYERTINIVAVTGTTTLNDVITALNALTPTAPDNTQLVTAALEGGGIGTDILLSSQATQFVVGNYDGEGHTVAQSDLAAFFAVPSSPLAEGDSLCIQYEMVVDPASTGGRRQSIPENSNTALPGGSLFNSRVNPEKLVNAIPLCKVVNGELVFATGVTIPAGGASAGFVALNNSVGSAVSYAGGPAWADGTTNPATTVEAQLDKIISDLSGAAGTGKIQGSAVGVDLSAGTLATQISSLVNDWFKLGRSNTVSGANLFTALQTLNGASDSDFSWGIDTPPNDTTGIPKPLWYAVLDATAGIKLRVYSTKQHGLMVTVNAAVTGIAGPNLTYARDAAAWADASVAEAVRLRLNVNGNFISAGEGNLDISWFLAHFTATWNDTNWQSGSIRTGKYKFTQEQTLVIPILSGVETTYPPVHSYTPAEIQLQDYGPSPASTNIYFPITGLHTGDIIKSYGVRLLKATNNNFTLNADVFENGFSATGGGVSNNDNVDVTPITLGTVCSVTVLPNSNYCVRLNATGTNASPVPNPDEIYAVEITYIRP